MMDLIDKLQLEDLEAEQHKLAEVIGIEAYRRLLKSYAGLGIYVPTVDTITLNLRDRLIREEYTGYNARELALKYGLTERWIQTITENIREVKRRAPLDGQESFLTDIKL